MQRLPRRPDGNGARRFIGEGKNQLFTRNHVGRAPLQRAVLATDQREAPVKYIAIADALQHSGQTVEPRLPLEYPRPLPPQQTLMDSRNTLATDGHLPKQRTWPQYPGSFAEGATVYLQIVEQ